MDAPQELTRACCYAAMCSGTDRMKQDVKVMFSNGEC